ncbi:MAG: ribosomal RNA small subunit methyltransferase A [Deltaproteobacteria bacterium]|nr:ribosomal RNA small subunit methyltransferase A [Deltaproteobacteria bacterium]
MTSPSILMKTWNLHPKKEMGQNFLADRGTADKIVARSGITAGDVVLEIGAGLGSLTLPIARTARKVYAIEKDSALLPPLSNELLASGADNVLLINDNILSLDIVSIARTEQQPLVIMGNIPYNISSQILVQLMMARHHLKKAALMFQKELALRIMAIPGSKAYGRLAVMAGYCSTVNVITEVKAARFFPKPKVDSLVIGISFKDHAEPSATDESFLFKVVKASFSKRRKTLKNALSGPILQIDAPTAARELVAAGIDPIRRAETLTVEEFVNLSNQLYQEGYR